MERVARGETLNLFQKFGRGVSVELSEEGLAELNKKPKTRPVWLVLSYSVRPNPANDSALLPFNLPFTMQKKPSLVIPIDDRHFRILPCGIMIKEGSAVHDGILLRIPVIKLLVAGP